MTWLDRVLEALQTAALMGERVERVSNDVTEVAVQLRELDRRVAQLEGAFAVLMSGPHRDDPPRLP